MPSAEPRHNMGSLAMDFPLQILLAVEKQGAVSSYEFAKALNEPHQKIVGAIKSLESLGEVSSGMNILHDLSVPKESLGFELLFIRSRRICLANAVIWYFISYSMGSGTS